MKKGLFINFLALIIACVGFFVGCNTEKTIEISAPNGVCQVAPSESITLKLELKGVSAENVTFSIIEGSEFAVITNDGKLTANNDAVVGEIIKVVAESKNDEVKSNELSITICNKFTSKLSLSADRNSLTADNNTLQLTPIFDNYVSNKNVSYEVVAGSDFVTVDKNGKVSLVADTTKYPTEKTTFKVKAIYDAKTEIYAELELTFLLPLQDVKNIAVENYTINAENYTDTYVSIVGRSESGSMKNIDAEYFNFYGDNTVASVAANGKISIKGHGTQEVTVKLAGNDSISKKFYIYVFATPTAISFDETKTNTYVAGTSTLSFGKSEGLKLADMLAFSKRNGLNVTEAFKVYVDGTEQTYTEEGLMFESTGTKTVKVVSDPSIPDFRGTTMPDMHEVSFEFTVNVNDGVNVTTVSEFKNYSAQKANTTANILANITLTATDNFGGSQEQGFGGLTFFGDRYIYGNGYAIDTENLPVAETGHVSLLEFKPNSESDEYYTVQISDLTLLGGATVQGVSVKDSTKSVVTAAKNEVLGVFQRGILVNQGYPINKGPYVKNFLLDNVTIKQFYTGLRLCHAVDGLLDKVYVDNCFGNGIEMVQNTVEIKDIHIGKVGAFGIEITPDDMGGEGTSSPSGRSGKDFNQAQSIKLTGTITSENYNSSTPYLDTYDGAVSSLTSGQVTSVAALVEAICGATVKAITGDNTAQAKLGELLTHMLKKDGQMNNFMLIFVNPEKFPGYTKGNTESKFAEYPEVGNMAKISEVLAKYAENPDTYTDYQNYQYLLMDLAAGSTNIGQVILVNQAYVAK